MRNTQKSTVNIKIADVSRITTLSRASIYRKLKDDPDFPRPRKLGANRIAWLSSEVEEYVLSREMM